MIDFLVACISFPVVFIVAIQGKAAKDEGGCK